MSENQKKVWITGASSGIGKATAEKFAKENWKVADLSCSTSSYKSGSILIARYILFIKLFFIQNTFLN